MKAGQLRMSRSGPEGMGSISWPWWGVAQQVLSVILVLLLLVVLLGPADLLDVARVVSKDAWLGG